MNRLLPALVCLCLVFAGGAAAAPLPGLADEAAEWDVDGLEPLLPRRETVAEREYWQLHRADLPALDLRDDPPPLAPVRNCAEWEPATGVLIRYPLGLPYNLLRDFDDDVKLYVVVSSGYLATAQSNLAANGVDMGQVEFVVRPNDSIWTRDYGPWYVFDGDGDIAIVDHTYNRPSRPNDDQIPIYLAQQLGLPVHHHSMYHTGGNYMTDGAHISSSTRLVYAEAQTYNGMSQAEVDQLMADYYGVAEYYVLEYIESGGIHHIDTWAKFLDEETVLVKDVWTTHWTYNTLNQRAALLASLPSSTGRNYRVHRVYCYDIGGSSPASYTNSLVLNDNIYVPTFGNTTYDAQALAAYREAAPGYTVRGYYYSGFLSDDALHCRAMGLMDAGMLRVAHVPVIEDQPAAPVEIDAHVRAHGGDGSAEATLFWRHGAGAWHQTRMDATGEPWEYAATIPVPAAPDTCHYYIAAADAGGREESYPRVAPATWIRFFHAGDPLGAGAAPAAQVALRPNHPNPFNPGTTFSFALAYPDHAELVVLDLRGRRVRTLVDGTCPAGTTEVYWDGRDDAGRSVPSGSYLYRLRAAGLQYTRAATLVK
ncbi:MAG TPA: agmatine deiminase family protein [Candidatus Krumholzibacteria bacterium]|nr:agmatine deiminase family protein [Candidatus Krumholzibacteria bacterium]HPD71668.1 agmatine deiminase family protein [Candidatus Krumholzibacteria bacterium]HRY41399.1 agmatine deiminase family protein [Candidatus Krumholzibacteria bacterium]